MSMRTCEPKRAKSLRRCASVALFMLLWAAAAGADDATGRISGVWMPADSGPVSGGLIYAFDTAAGPAAEVDRFFCRVADAVALTDGQGRFSMDLPEGAYYLAVQKKTANHVPGPPDDGDLSGLVRNDKQEPLVFRVQRGKTNDVGVLRSAPVFRLRPLVVTEGMMGIAGTITAADGTPLADAVALVYDNPDIRGRPKYISYKTGKDGRYLVPLDQAGTYFVAARPAYSNGRPKKGDTYGIHGGETAEPVAVKRQCVAEGIDIRTGPFVDKRENRPQ